jgi:hypothetical protein
VVIAIGHWLGQPIWFALFAHLAFTTLTVALVFHAVHRLTLNVRLATIGAWAVALEPTMLIWSLKVLSETLFTTLLVACVAAAVRGMEARPVGGAEAPPYVLSHLRWSMAMGVALAASIYVRPIAYPLLVIIPVAMAAALSGSWKGRLRRAAVLVLTCVALLAPWHVRNWFVAEFPGFSTVAERALVISIGGSINARLEHQPFLEVRRRLVERLDAADRIRGEQAPAAIRHEAWDTLTRNPLVYLGIHLQGIARTVVDPSGVEYMRILGWYPAVGGFQSRAVDEGISTAMMTLIQHYPATVIASMALGIVSLPFLLGPVLALRRLHPSTTAPFVVLASVAVYLLIAGGGVPGNSRFRAPTMPLVVMMTACGWRSRSPILSARRTPG